MKTAICLLLAALSLVAQTATRQVSLSWTASPSTGVTGYTISTGSSATGPFAQIGCVGTVAGATCVSGSTASTTSYNDVQSVGNTVFYQVVAVAPACTSTTPVSQACGVSPPAAVNTTIPPVPGSVTTIIVTVK